MGATNVIFHVAIIASTAQMRGAPDVNLVMS